MDEFKPRMPLITTLLNPGMRQRHWQLLSHDLGVNLQPNESFTLKDLFALNLESRLDTISKVTDVDQVNLADIASHARPRRIKHVPRPSLIVVQDLLHFLKLVLIQGISIANKNRQQTVLMRQVWKMALTMTEPTKPNFKIISFRALATQLRAVMITGVFWNH